MSFLGNVYTLPRLGRVRIAAHDGRTWVGETLDRFSPPLPLSNQELLDAGVSAEDLQPSPSEAEILRDRDAAANNGRLNSAYARAVLGQRGAARARERAERLPSPPEGSPEAIFATHA